MARPFRYTLILVVVALGTTLAAVGGWRYARASAPLSGPIIVISIDTLRSDHLPPYGYSLVKTPAISSLAADGVVFERAYSHVPQTLPAHATLLSGRLPFETGVQDDEWTTVKSGERLLPQMLRERGYATAGIVSSALLSKETGISQGFEVFDATMPPHPADVSPASVRRDGGESESAAERWLDTVGTSRAFLFLHLNEPRQPYTPQERFSMYSPYDAAIASSDEIVGRLVRYLKSHQLYDRSTIILVSDHGEGLGDHGEHEHGLSLHQEVLHVPLIVKQESNVGAGRRVSDVVQHIDLVPTVLDLVKAPAPGQLRGRSLKPLLDGPGHLPARTVYAESRYASFRFGWRARTAAFDGRFHFLGGSSSPELYDLDADPRERHNIEGENAAVRGRLEKAIVGLPSSDKAGQSVATASPGGTAEPGDGLEIVEEYRKAQALSDRGEWAQSVAILQRTVNTHPDLTEVWTRLAKVAARIDRFDIAADAYQHVVSLTPGQPAGLRGAAEMLLKLRKLDEAREDGERAVEMTDPRDSGALARTHELLARIALARRDVEGARSEATRAQEFDPAWPVQPYVEGRIAHDRGDHESALPLFEQALAAASKAGGARLDELHFYTAETLLKLDRSAEAEYEYLEATREAPQHVRAHAALAALYLATGRTDEAEEAVRVLTRLSPTPDGYAAAARLWTTMGKPHEAASARLEARRAAAGRSSARTSVSH